MPVSKPQIDLPPVEPVPETRSEQVGLARCLPWSYYRPDDPREHSGRFSGHLSAADALGLEWLDHHRCRLPVLPLDCRCEPHAYLSKRMKAGAPRSRLALRVLRRGAILYLLGLLIYAFPKFDLATMRILGVLQRIAICYVAASLLYLWTGVRTQIACIVVLLAGYWLLMMLVPVPGYGTGRLDVEGNFAHYIDSHRARLTQLCQHENLGPGGHRQHAAGDRHRAVRHHGGILLRSSARSPSAPRGCFSPESSLSRSA